MKVRPIFSVGSLLLLFVIGVAYVAFGVLGFDPSKKYTSATMVLTNSVGLVANSPVLLTGVPVGSVTAVRNSAAGVEVELRFDDSYRIPASSAVRIENLSGLGETYVEFAPLDEDGPYIQNDQIIDTHQVEMPMSIPHIANRLVELLKQFDPHVIGSLVDTTDKALHGVESVVPQLARSTNLLDATVLSRTATLHQLLIDLQGMGSDMDWLGPSLNDTGPQITRLGSGMGEAVNGVRGLSELPNSPGRYLTGDGLVPFLGNLTSFLEKIGPSASQLVPVVRPLIDDTLRTIPSIDISTLISQALSVVGDDGTLHLQIHVR